MSKYLNRISFSSQHENESIRHRLDIYLETIAGRLLKAPGKYGIKNTSILHFTLHNDVQRSSKSHYSLGASVISVGVITTYFDHDEFLANDDRGKLEVVRLFIVSHLVALAEKFQLSATPFQQAYEKQKGTDLIYFDEKGTLNSGRRFRAHKKVTTKFESRIYYIVIDDIRQKTSEEIFICEKDHFFGIEHPELTIHQLLEIDQFLKYDGWIDPTTYRMKYNDEVYLFNADTRQLEKKSRT